MSKIPEAVELLYIEACLGCYDAALDRTTSPDHLMLARALESLYPDIIENLRKKK